MSANEYKAAIAKTAKARLTPLGAFEHGSGTWLIDHGYWLAVAGFQLKRPPNAMFLNMGAHWLWSHSGPGFSLDYGAGSLTRTRIDGAFSFEGNDDPHTIASRITSAAATEFDLIAAMFPSVSHVSEVLLDAKGLGPGFSWSALHAGIATALAGDFRIAKELLDRPSLSVNETIPWQLELAKTASQLGELTATPTVFKERITQAVIDARAKLKLPEMPINFFSA